MAVPIDDPVATLQRMGTFAKWPGDIRIPRMLAKIGFIYIPDSGEVQCFVCGRNSHDFQNISSLEKHRKECSGSSSTGHGMPNGHSGANVDENTAAAPSFANGHHNPNSKYTAKYPKQTIAPNEHGFNFSNSRRFPNGACIPSEEALHSRDPTPSLTNAVSNGDTHHEASFLQSTSATTSTRQSETLLFNGHHLFAQDNHGSVFNQNQVAASGASLNPVAPSLPMVNGGSYENQAVSSGSLMNPVVPSILPMSSSSETPMQQQRSAGHDVPPAGTLTFTHGYVPRDPDYSPPRHPEYASPSVRLQSYNNWECPYITAQEMAEAGFFYAGIKDYVRCFHCHGGLHNWLPGDNSWIEHVRWFPKCVFVKMAKGPAFVQGVSSGIINSLPKSPATGASNVLEPKAHVPVPSQPKAVQLPTASKTSSPTPENGKSGDIRDMLKQLEEEKNKIKTVNEQLKEDRKCQMCHLNDVCTLFLPCSHLVTCESCGASTTHCPKCGNLVRGTVKTYRG